MPGRGFPPAPTKLKILRGNPGRRPLPVGEPEPKLGAPKMPAWLPKEAKAEWKRIAPELESLGILAYIDVGALAAYCVACADLRSATETVEKEGSYKGLKLHPAQRIKQEASTRIKQFLQEFGLSPASRTRIRTPDGANKKESPLEALASRAAHIRNGSG